MMRDFLPGMVDANSRWAQENLVQMERILSEDADVLMNPNHPFLGKEWNCEVGPQSRFETSYSIQRSLSSPSNAAERGGIEPSLSSAAGGGICPKKRKSDDCKDAKIEMKKMKPSDEEDSKITAADCGHSKSGKSPATSKTKENSKSDYIHVRARRGQATDSHSLAERVRREKISERMKYLQDLVPGCNKITGKAGMLDEIINYVQSLQRQVELLSMKLAAVSPRLDFNTEACMSKEHILPAILPATGMAHFQLDPFVGRTIPQNSLLIDSQIEQQQQLTWEDELQISSLHPFLNNHPLLNWDQVI